MKYSSIHCLAIVGPLILGAQAVFGVPESDVVIESDVAPKNDASFEIAGETASWTPPSPAVIREQVFKLLADRKIGPKKIAMADQLWPVGVAKSKDDGLLDLVVKTLAIAEPRAEALIRFCNRPSRQIILPNVLWLTQQETPPIIGNNLRLFYIRYLAHRRLYDELLQQAEGLSIDEVVDPTALLFYRSVAQHRLLRIEPCLNSVATLLQRSDSIPRRYEAVARLIELDIKDVKDDSLDHISRRMDDVGRRLALGRAGQKVRDVEDGVIESLDKLIKKIKDARNQAQPKKSPTPSGKPAQESRIARGRGEGRVDRRDIGSGSGWGDLPAKERERALQQIGKDFPSHYREVIEEYFRKLATEQHD